MSHSAPLAPPEHIVSLTQEVKGQLERMILTGEIAAGTRLNELSVAKQLGVSRAPVREAVRALEQAGLVTIIPNRGVVVRKIGLEEALDLYDIRAGLARSAGRILALRISVAELRMLEQLHADMVEAVEQRDVGAYYELNLRFHALLMSATHNRRLAELDEMIRNQLQLHLRRGVAGASQLRTSLGEHARIIEAIQAGNAEKAGKMFETHVLSGKQRTLDNLVSQGEADA